jgi:hypothetical protein
MINQKFPGPGAYETIGEIKDCSPRISNFHTVKTRSFATTEI